MKRWLFLATLPWAVVASTYPGNCTKSIDSTSQAYTENCETKTSYAITYNGAILACCGDTDSSCMSSPPCDWMQDVTAAFNEMANARRSRLSHEDQDFIDRGKKAVKQMKQSNENEGVPEPDQQ